MKTLCQRWIKRIFDFAFSDMHNSVVAYQKETYRRIHPNPLNRYGATSFSQSDEDGITLEILKRIGLLDAGVFAEFGVGNGLENNTLVLKALGWRGFWVGQEDLAFSWDSGTRSFFYQQTWVTRDNVVSLVEKGCLAVDATGVDVLSLDLDGNDIYFVEALLSAQVFPSLFIVEYNAKFIPPIEWQMSYNPEHVWQRDDCFGASLASFCTLFSRYGYTLVCCNADTGANAFFVKNIFLSFFSDVPKQISDLYVPPRYQLCKTGHPRSVKTVAQLFEK